MPLLKSEAAKLSNNDLLAGIIEEIIDVDQTFGILPFQRVNGKALVYNREKTISEGQFLDPNDTVPEGASTFDEITTKLRVLAGDVDVDKFIEETMSDRNSQRAIQIAEKVKGIGNKFRNEFINGDVSVNAKGFDGISRLATATGNEVDGAGAAIDLGMLDELVDGVPNGGAVLIMNRRTLRQVRALWRMAGGNTGGDMQMSNFGMVMPTHDGTPILVNDFIGVDGTTDQTSVYAARMNEVDGLHGLFGGESAGIRIEDLGTVQNKDANRTRIKWYAGLALKSTQSLAALRNAVV